MFVAVEHTGCLQRTTIFGVMEIKFGQVAAFVDTLLGGSTRSHNVHGRTTEACSLAVRLRMNMRTQFFWAIGDFLCMRGVKWSWPKPVLFPTRHSILVKQAMMTSPKGHTYRTYGCSRQIGVCTVYLS
jgi:hypothetical protein